MYRFGPILWAVVLLLARVHVIPDERQKTILSPPLPRQQWLSSLSFMLSHSIIFFQDLVNFVRSLSSISIDRKMSIFFLGKSD